MPATVILGGQWGDEGKGKITDTLAANAAMVVRANGGSNAGHTVRVGDETYKFHLVPSGVLNPDCLCVIGAGTVVDPVALLTEMDGLRARGINLQNLRISDRAHLLLPYHPMLDRAEESRREDEEIGTTLTGNGPAYADKVARRGIRMADLTDDAALLRKLSIGIDEKNQLLGGVYRQPLLNLGETYRELVEAGTRLREHICPAEVLVQDALADGKQVLVECAQGAMLDVDYGTYPFVTSSSPTAAGACQGAGVAPTQVQRVVGVFKAYSTRVGNGPLPAELQDETGALIRERGREYGTTTGRPRRTGWFDAVAAAYVARMNGVSEIAITLLDVLDVFDEVRVCTGYRLNEVAISYLPAREDLLAQVSPVFTPFPGWLAPTTDARELRDLPPAALGYLRFVEMAVGAPISMVGVGPERTQVVQMGEAVTA
jgi:adenylosuccinate synthase